jgi:hypothetical protein
MIHVHAGIETIHADAVLPRPLAPGNWGGRKCGRQVVGSFEDECSLRTHYRDVGIAGATLMAKQNRVLIVGTKERELRNPDPSTRAARELVDGPRGQPSLNRLDQGVVGHPPGGKGHGIELRNHIQVRGGLEGGHVVPPYY